MKLKFNKSIQQMFEERGAREIADSYDVSAALDKAIKDRKNLAEHLRDKGFAEVPKTARRFLVC